MARVQREYSPTGCYHIMMRGNERKRIFLDDNDRRRFLDTVLKKKHEFGLIVYGYCLMDNHIHLILRNDRYDISTIMRGIATSYAMFFNIKYNRVGHVFQGRFKSEPVVDDRYLLAVLRYVHNNPVKAGIVEKPEHYEWSSYCSYLSPGETKLGDVKSVLEMFSSNVEKAINEFRRFSNDQDESEYLDEKEETIKTLEEGLVYLNKYLSEKWPGLHQEAILEDKVKRNEIIFSLRNNTELSIRKIAELLGLHRRVIDRIIAKGS